MTTLTHDPYLDTAKRSIKNRRYKELSQEKEKPKKRKSESFLTQKVNINELSNLPEGTMNLLLFIAFLLIPYIVGIVFIFVVIAHVNLNTFTKIYTNEYLLYWAIGYEIVAATIILLIIKSAINFHRLQNNQKKVLI